MNDIAEIERLTSPTCFDCGKAFGPEDMEYTHINQNTVCLECYERLTDGTYDGEDE